MIRFLLLRLWPALIPLILYALWYVYKRHHAKKTGETIHLTDGPWMVTLFSALVLAALSFIILGMSRTLHDEPLYYHPAQVIDGKIVDGRIDSQK